jgi:hypothetical protein
LVRVPPCQRCLEVVCSCFDATLCKLPKFLAGRPITSSSTLPPTTMAEFAELQDEDEQPIKRSALASCCDGTTDFVARITCCKDEEWLSQKVLPDELKDSSDNTLLVSESDWRDVKKFIFFPCAPIKATFDFLVMFCVVFSCLVIPCTPHSPALRPRARLPADRHHTSPSISRVPSYRRACHTTAPRGVCLFIPRTALPARTPPKCPAWRVPRHRVPPRTPPNCCALAPRAPCELAELIERSSHACAACVARLLATRESRAGRADPMLSTHVRRM